MKTLLSLLLIIFLFPLNSLLANEKLAEIVIKDGVEQLLLRMSLYDYLTSEFSGFEIPTVEDKRKSEDWKLFTKKEEMPPVYVIDDFNGDKKEDIALLMADRSGNGLLVVIHSLGDNKYKQFQLEKIEAREFSKMYIKKQKPGEVLTTAGKGYDHSGPKKVNPKNTSINFGVFETTSMLYYWEGKEYKKVWTSD